MNISILLPYKENFVSNKAGAVSLFVNDITKNSIYQKTTKIFGNTIYKKILSNNYINLVFDRKIFFSSNNLYVKSFLEHKEILNSDLIEVHNRPNYIKIIKTKYQNRLFLYFHNDPLQMNGSKTTKERMSLLNNVDKIIFNSEWTRSRFFINLDDYNVILKKHPYVFNHHLKLRLILKRKKI